MSNNNPSKGTVGGQVNAPKNPAQGVMQQGCGDIKTVAAPTPAPRVETIVSTVNPTAPANDVQK